MKRLASGKVKPGQEGELEELQELICRICFDLLENPQVTECMHRFCKKCINQHLRNFERKQHMCPLCNKQIKTTRSVKPDLVVANLISVLYPNRQKSESQEDMENNCSLGEVIRDATEKHMEQLKKMRESQVETVMRQYPGLSQPMSAEDQPYPAGANVPQRTSDRRAGQQGQKAPGSSSSSSGYAQAAAYQAAVAAAAKTKALADADTGHHTGLDGRGFIPGPDKAISMSSPLALASGLRNDHGYDLSEYDQLQVSALLGGMKHYNVPKQDKVKFSHHTGYVENESMDSVVGLRTQEILENRVSPAVHYIPQSGLNKEVLVVGGAPQWVPSPTALSPS